MEEKLLGSGDAGESSGYGRILLEKIPKEFERPYALGPKEKVMVTDLSSLGFFLNEFIALAAVRFAVPVGSEVESAIEHLGPLLRNRVNLIEEKEKSFSKYAVILSPIQEEFKIRLTRVSYPGAFALHVERDVGDEVRGALAEVFFNLRTFLMGIDYELQINLDIRKLKAAVDIVRKHSKNDNARTMLATISALLGSYRHDEISCLEMVPHSYKGSLEMFNQFLEDEMFKLMSKQSYGLGIPQAFKKSVTSLKGLVKNVVTKSPFKQIFTLGSKAISASTSMPIPDSEWILSLYRKPYLPPVVNFKTAIKKAHDSWVEAGHEPIAPQGFGPWGFIEIPKNVDVSSWLAKMRGELE